MAEWAVPIANCEEVLVRLVLNVCVNYERVLVDFVWV